MAVLACEMMVIGDVTIYGKTQDGNRERTKMILL